MADLRADHGALAQVVRQLEKLGFALESISTDGLAHRYARSAQPRSVLLDVLAPDGLGARADLTTSPPGRTIEVPGGTQALSRTERIVISHEGRQGDVPRPTLLAAIIIKAAATGLPSPARHYRDLACSAHSSWIRSRLQNSSRRKTASDYDKPAPWPTIATLPGLQFRPSSEAMDRSRTQSLQVDDSKRRFGRDDVSGCAFVFWPSDR